MCWRRSRLCLIEPGATGLRAVANTTPRWKPACDKYPATHETSGIEAENMEPLGREVKHRNHGNEGPEHDRIHHDYRPYWKRAHHDWRFWIGLFLMLAAITIYVLSDNLAFLPHR